MKVTALLLLFVVVFLCAASPLAGQTQRPRLTTYTLVIPAKDFNWADAAAAARTASGLQI